MHTIIEVAPFTASEPGALDGHDATCSCGFVAKTSLSANVARRAGQDHADFMNRLERYADMLGAKKVK